MNFQELHSQCHTQLIESDKKRDQVIAFYVAIVGAFFAFADKNTTITSVFIFALTILGFLLSSVIVQYRKWHIRYINSAKIIGFLVVNPQSKPGQAMKQLYQSIYDDTGVSLISAFPRSKFLRRYFQGIEMITYQAFLVVAFVPLYLILQEINVQLLPSSNWIINFSVELILYLSIMNGLSIFYLYNDFKKELPFAQWVLPMEEVKTLKDIISNTTNKFPKTKNAA